MERKCHSSVTNTNLSESKSLEMVRKIIDATHHHSFVHLLWNLFARMEVYILEPNCTEWIHLLITFYTPSVCSAEHLGMNSFFKSLFSWSHNLRWHPHRSYQPRTLHIHLFDGYSHDGVHFEATLGGIYIRNTTKNDFEKSLMCFEKTSPDNNNDQNYNDNCYFRLTTLECFYD